MNSEKPQPSRFAAWKADEDKKYHYSGTIDLTPELLMQIFNSYGWKLRGVRLAAYLYDNQSDKELAPIVTGYIRLQTPETTQTARRADREEIPF